MGIGDSIMVTGEAKQVHSTTGHQCVPGNGQVHWSEVYDNNPRMTKSPNNRTVWLKNYKGNRPYIIGNEDGKFIFDENYRAPYGELYLTNQEKEWAASHRLGDYIVVEPNVKDRTQTTLCLGENKRWRFWGDLMKLDYPWLTLGDTQGAGRWIRTKTFRHAMAMLANAKLLVTTDGALHHAAAALGVPAIVLWGGVVSPKLLGYPTQINVWNGAKSCGSWKEPCPHCRDAMDSISVDQVRKHL